MVPLKNALHSYSYCSGRLGDKLYGIKKSFFPEEWRRPASYPHSHDFPQIWYCLRGEVSIVLAGKTYKLSRGQFVAVPIGMAGGCEKHLQNRICHLRLH